MEWTPLIIGLTAAYFIGASITTVGIRLGQAERDGRLQPDQPLPPDWVIAFDIAQWVIFIVLLYLNWKYAIALFVSKFILKALHVLEIVGNILICPFKPRK